MKRSSFVLLLCVLLISFQSCKVADVTSTSQPVTHELWDSLLKDHVTMDGWVDYEGFQKDSIRLNDYLDLLSNNHPNEKHWTKNERLAYWINAYNAFTVKIVADHYPVASIKDIKNGIPFVNTVWDIKFISIEDEKYDLNNIEHGILRPKFNEPRIHFAVNCASYSCPPLANFAFEAELLDKQLDGLARNFINDPLRNQVKSADQAQLSKIFTWFKGDFTKEGSLIEYINQYATTQLDQDADIEFLEYNWAVNAIENSK